ncbi:LacI family transcriptional regulator [Arthrobacter sp. SW1]|uniref:LacI family DNA-binding transcriptional regulator n=1 Tax=Arthrobacter sp. SW1 TaxID=1920889 RepID=UPI000877B42D|nr:LacI family DNA-binding transcriptional regulator [Arthrobacter sp. SW1]OFI37973.1 LacI family transcriptional regulator [Arthrobacter sp. SW1]
MRSASVKDVADRAGVAVGTVSHVLNHPERVSPRTKERVLRAIAELGFVRNDAARQLRAGRSRTIGLVMLDAANPFFASLARGAEDAAAEAGNSVVFASSRHDPERESRYIDLFEEQRVQGLLITPVGDLSSRVSELKARGVAVVLVDREGDPELYSSVSVDDVHGGYLAASHLLQAGRSRLAFVGGGKHVQQVADRLRGAEKAVAEHPGATLEFLPTPELDVLAGRSVGDELLKRPRHSLPDGIFCANDLLATGMMQSILLMNSLRIPDDVALIGYDDIAFARSAVVPLSSIRQPAEEIGRTAIRLLAQELEDPEAGREHVVFKPELVGRASTGVLESVSRP